MKKLVFVCMFLGFATQAFAQLNEKELMGTWKYSVMTDQGQLTGILNFGEEEGKLSGKVVSNDGQTWTMDSLELKEANTVNFEVTPQGETFKSTLKFVGDTFTGMTGPTHTQYKVTGEREL